MLAILTEPTDTSSAGQALPSVVEPGEPLGEPESRPKAVTSRADPGSRHRSLALAGSTTKGPGHSVVEQSLRWSSRASPWASPSRDARRRGRVPTPGLDT